MKPDICIYHAPCQDGFTAAWAVWKRWPDIQFHPGVYGESPPDVKDKHVLIVDFSYKRAVLDEMLQTAASVVIIDHHKTALADLEEFRFEESSPGAISADDIPGMLRDLLALDRHPCVAIFDMKRSGAMMAWQFCHGGAQAPILVEHVQDRDLWRFEMFGTREVCADLFSRPCSFEVWDDLATALDDPDMANRIFDGGAAIERKHHKDVKELLRVCTREMIIGGHCVLVANIPYTMSSDAANILAEERPFGACYFDNADGYRVFSLRSKDGGEDVSKIAASYGGGGHARAAGFTAPCGWEGDQ